MYIHCMVWKPSPAISVAKDFFIVAVGNREIIHVLSLIFLYQWRLKMKKVLQVISS